MGCLAPGGKKWPENTWTLLTCRIKRQVSYYPVQYCHIPQERVLQIHDGENLKTDISCLLCQSLICFAIICDVKQALYRPLGLQEVETLRLLDSLHMKVIRLTALRTGRMYPPTRKFSWYSFLTKAEATREP
jgi:hypothetical protein